MKTDQAPIAALRESTRVSEDPRALAVRERLFDAIQRMCDADAHVSVSALVREAGVSRSVFYAHFTGIPDLVMRLQESRFAAIAEYADIERDADPAEAMLTAQRRLVAHFSLNRKLYRVAFTLSDARDVEHGITAAIATTIRRHISETGCIPSGIDARIAARYIAGAATSVLAEWLRDPELGDEETIARHLFALMPSWMWNGPQRGE